MTEFEVIRDTEIALDQSCGTSLKGYIHNTRYSELIKALGQPTFVEESGDGKVQFEWVCEFNGDTYTIYDWKTYDVEYTINELTTWNIGGRGNAYDFIDYVEDLVEKANQK